jgi:hypothetical protein
MSTASTENSDVQKVTIPIMMRERRVAFGRTLQVGDHIANVELFIPKMQLDYLVHALNDRIAGPPRE